MRENQTSNSVHQSVSDSVAVSTNGQQPKTNSFLVILLSILLFISVVIAGFFAYQTQKLVAELRIMKDEVLLTPTATVEPVATDRSAIDPMTEWKTITRKYWSLKVPKEMNYLECNSYDLLRIGIPNNQMESGSFFDKDQTVECNFGQIGELINIFRGADNSQNNIIIPTNTDPSLDPVVSEVKLIIVDGKTGTFQRETTSFGQGTGTRYKVYIHDKNFMNVITFTDTKQKALFDQILSTFKFTN